MTLVAPSVRKRLCSLCRRDVKMKPSLVSLQYMRSLNNFRAEQPHQHAMYYLRLLMTEVAWTKDELREALDGETTLSLFRLLSLLPRGHL